MNRVGFYNQWMVVWLIHCDICHGYLPGFITVIVVSTGKVHETKRAVELPLKKLHFGWEHPIFFRSNAPSMYKRKLTPMKTFLKDPMAAVMSVLWKIAVMQTENALSMHANSTDVATTGVQSLCDICPLATCSDGRQLGCTSTLSFDASVSRFLFWQKQVNPNFKRWHLVPYNKKEITRMLWVPFPGVGESSQGDGRPSCLQWYFISTKW